MGLAERFIGSIVYIDSAPLIYYFERKPDYFSELNSVFKAFERGDIKLVSSTLTITEVLTYPIRLRKIRLIKTYESFFLNHHALKLIDVGVAESKVAAEIRAQHNVKTPDAIHLATAITSGAAFFLTNDFQLKKVSSIEIVTLK